MAVTRYAGDRFVGDVAAGSLDTTAALTGVLNGAYYIDSGNLTQFVKRIGGWTALAGGGGGGSPGGSNTQVQFNNVGTFGASEGLTYSYSNGLDVNTLRISGSIYDSNDYVGDGGMVLTNEGATGVHWKSIESVLSGVGGSGVANYVARWSDEDTLTSGVIQDNGTSVGIRQAPDASNTLSIKSVANNENVLQVAADDGDGLLNIRQSANDCLVRGYKDGNVQTIQFHSDGASYFNGGSVGIGNNAPGCELHVSGEDPRIRVDGIANSHPGFEFSETGIRKWIIYNNYVNDILAFKTDSDTRMIIQQDGNVGIGTTSAGELLHVREDHNTDTLIKVQNNTAGALARAGLWLASNSNNALVLVADDGYTAVADWADTLILNSNAGAGIRFACDSATKMTILADGKVGIGTDGSGGKLQIVQGGAGRKSTFSTSLGLTIQANDNSVPAALNLVNTYAGANYGTTLGYQLGYSGSSSAAGELVDAGKITVAATQTWTDVPNTQDSYMTFQTAKNGSLSEHVRINQDGEVGIGTDDPIAQLHISGADTSDQVLIQNSSSSSTSAPDLVLDRPSTTPAAGDNIGLLQFRGRNSAGESINYASLLTNLVDKTDGDEDGKLSFYTYNAGTETESMVIKSNYVGIGVALPEHKLHVVGDAIISGVLYDSTNSSGVAGHVFTSEVGGPQWKMIEDVLSGVGGNGTAEYIPRWTDSDTIGDSVMAQSGSYIGIGTDAPGKTLDVNGDIRIRGDSGTLSFYRDTSPSDIAYIKYLNGTSRLDIAANNKAIVFMNENGPAESMRITSAGSVGIGTNAPGFMLQVDEGTTATYAASIRNANDNLQLKLGTTTGALLNIQGSKISDDAAYDINLQADGGQVGIGTNNPGYRLDVYETVANIAIFRSTITSYARVVIRAGATGDAQLTFQNNTASKWTIGNDGGDSDKFKIEAGGGAFGTSPLVCILDDGNFGIGTNTPGAKLEVAVDGLAYNAPAMILEMGTSGASQGVFEFQSDSVAKGRIRADEDGTLVISSMGSGDILFRQDDADGSTLAVMKNDGNVGINTLLPEHKLHVAGDAIISGVLYDSTNSSGVSGHVLTSEVGGPQWKMIEDVLSGVGGNGTANYVPKWEDSDTIGNSIIYDNGSNIGIGNALPSGTLDIVGSNGTVDVAADGDAQELVIRNNDRAGIQILSSQTDMSSVVFGSAADANGANISYGPTSKLLTIGSQIAGGQVVFRAANGVEAVRIDAAGEVGIGTNAPGSVLHLNHLSEHTRLRMQTIATKAALIDFYSASTARWSWGVDNNQAYAKFENRTTANDAIRLVDSDDSVLLAPEAGNVGVGTTNPKTLLEASGVIRSTHATTVTAGVGIEMLYNTGTEIGYLYSYDRDAPAGYKTTRIGTDAYFNVSGNLGVGVEEPVYKFHVDGDAIISGVLYDQTNSTGDKGYVLTSDDNGPLWKASGDFDGLSADLIATGQTLTTDINAVASNLVLTGAFVDTNTAGVATNVANLIATGAFVDTNTLGIATNVTNISTNASNLIATGAFVDTNTAGVATNVTNIATNASNLIATGAFVDTNTLGIATNVTNISTNASNLILTGAFVDTNTAGVATNVTNISTNASNLILTGAIVDDVSGNLITTGQFLTNALPVGADPSAVISGAATNGSATTFMRSDAAPALKDTEVTAGAYTYTAITVDAQGRLTAASNGVAPGGGTVTGTGTNTYIPRWNGTTALHDSSISDSGSSVYMSRSSGLTPLVLLSNPANQVADIGGELIFQATYRATSGGQSTPVARIKGARENATTNNWAGRLTFHTSPGGDSPSASTEQMRIQSDGKVGIGHVTPSSKLTIDDPSAQTAINLASCAVMIRAATAAAQYSNIGFNYAGGVHEPQCTIGIQQKQWAAYTYADLVFATRSVTTNTAPTERMRIQHDGNVGIGIVAPAQLLHLQKAGGAKLRIQETGAEAWDLYAAGSLFGILQDGTYRLVIKDTGNVGIGTDAPEANLVVAGGGGHEAIFRTNEATAAQRAGGGFSSLGHSNSVSRYARMFLDADGANFSGTDYFTIEKFGNGGEVRLINYGNAYMTFWVNTSTEALVIKNDGNVGIGDAAPGSKVHIKDDAPVTSGALRYSLGITDNDTVAIGRGGGIDFLARYSDTGPTYSGYAGIQGYRENATNNNSAGALILLSRPAGGDLTERIRVQSDGNVGIGTVTSAYKLRVEGDSIATGDTYIYNNKALNILDSGGQRSLMITNYSSGSNSPYFSADPDQQAANTMMYWWIDASEKMSLDSGGNLSIQGTLTEASSIAIKENIETYSPSLENISKMRPVRFNKKKSKKKEVGLVAEELAEMFPELVETDEKGNAVGVNYSRAVAVLLHGFKELYKEVKELKEKI